MAVMEITFTVKQLSIRSSISQKEMNEMHLVDTYLAIFGYWELLLLNLSN